MEVAVPVLAAEVVVVVGAVLVVAREVVVVDVEVVVVVPDVADAPDNAEMAGSATIISPAAAAPAMGIRSHGRYVFKFRCLA